MEERYVLVEIDLSFLWKLYPHVDVDSCHDTSDEDSLGQWAKRNPKFVSARPPHNPLNYPLRAPYTTHRMVFVAVTACLLGQIPCNEPQLRFMNRGPQTTSEFIQLSKCFAIFAFQDLGGLFNLTLIEHRVVIEIPSAHANISQSLLIHDVISYSDFDYIGFHLGILSNIW
ncbi:hypothetical protein HAX54_012405 [Datura stramonium]|uniref:Uncharacterized protein n=1 Tax=Datura stramonium TaxID=4076 RepID=A0ABS8RZX0_DATST|nr:hypothetical protein [Datura stramonium]